MGPSSAERRPVLVIGAGPAGLTAAHELAERGIPAIVFERDVQVGGLARTVTYQGYRFDIGGHRFFTKVEAVQRLWEEVLGEDFLVRPFAAVELNARIDAILRRSRACFEQGNVVVNFISGIALPGTGSIPVIDDMTVSPTFSAPGARM